MKEKISMRLSDICSRTRLYETGLFDLRVKVRNTDSNKNIVL